MTDKTKTERVTAACTEYEKEALSAVSLVRGKTISELLYEMSIRDAVAEYKRLLGVLVQ
jgi:hypothetical protein